MSLKLNLIYYFFIILSLPFLVLSNENEDIKSDILFLKIQELESEIAELRNKIETQNFLIEKLLRESLAQSNDYDSDSESDDDYNENEFKKLDNELKQNYLLKYHQETQIQRSFHFLYCQKASPLIYPVHFF